MAKKTVTLPNGTTYTYDTLTGVGTLVRQGDPLIGGTNNPAPVDNSLYQQPPANPINIPAGTPVIDAAKIDWSTVATDDGLNDYAENYADVEPIGQTSYPYKKVTQDAPEEVFVDNDEVESGVSGGAVGGSDGSMLKIMQM